VTERSFATRRLVEAIGMILVLLGLFRVYMLFNSNGYLPPPFVFDVGDTFMDWYNTAYWAHNPGAYSVWRTIYLPLSFVITGLLGDSSCYNSHPYDARACDTFGIYVILATYLGCVIVTALAFYRRDRATALFRTVAIAVGGPLLFALERGNLIMMAFMAFVMLFGGLLKSSRGFALAAGLAANLKVYMIFPIAALAIKREWRLFELCGISALAIYIVTLGIVGAGTPVEFIDNLQNWFSVRLTTIWDELLYTTTYRVFLEIDVNQYPVRDYLEEKYVEYFKYFVQYYLISSRGVALLCIGLAWLYPKTISITRLVFFLLMQSFVVQNPGGYSIAIIVFLVFMERWRNFGTGLAIVCAYLMSVPGDVPIAKIIDVIRESWLSGRVVLSEYVLPAGALIRPGLIAIMLWALAIDSLIDFHRAAKAGRPSFPLVPSWKGTAGVRFTPAPQIAARASDGGATQL
jgi:hypothetical protein